MKTRIALVAAAVALAIGLSGCTFILGPNTSGNVYVSLNKQSSVTVTYMGLAYASLPTDFGYLSFPDLPKSLTLGKYYKLPGTGKYYGSYLLYAAGLWGYYYYDCTYSTYGSLYYTLSEPTSSDAAYAFSYKVVANSSSSLFSAPDDRYYDIYLCFNPADSYIKSPKGLSKSILACTTSVGEDGSIVKTFTDDAYTITLTLSSKGGPAKGHRLQSQQLVTP
jgi:hypothetical protein